MISEWIDFDGEIYDLPSPREGLQVETIHGEWYLIGDIENSSVAGGCGCCGSSIDPIARYINLLSKPSRFPAR